MLLVILSSCSSKQTKKSVPPTSKTSTQTQAKGALSANEHMELAQQSNENQRIVHIVNAAQLLIEEGDYKKALWLANQSLILTDSPEQLFQFRLVMAESLHLLQLNEQAYEQINHINKLTNSFNIYTKHYFEVLTNIQHQRNLPVAALDAKLRAVALSTPNEYALHVDNIWHSLNKLSQWEIDELSQLSPPYFNGWKQLLNFAHRFGYQPSSFRRYLTQWQRDFDSHPAQKLLDQLEPAEILFDDVDHHIAIILPLSGKRKSAGEAAQQGVLAAYSNKLQSNLHFIDSEGIDFSILNETFENLKIDHVIGPLLKNNVDAYVGNNQLTLPTLLLNVPNNGILRDNHMVLSMTPEDEAIQAATTLSRKNYVSPIIFTQQDGISQRIANKFAQQWLHITGRKPEIIAFQDASKVQEKLKSTLEVDLSQKRINEIDKRIRQKLKTQARNRLDIDMIYIVASPNETQLLKPYIDINISPFARAIPVFASSRSHSDNADKSDSRDLTGLTFTEMPWLLNSKQQNKSLKRLNGQIWPQRSDSLERIFAMGYDSLSLIKKFDMFKQKPYIRHYGQTGVLKLNEQGVLTRSLLWGRYQKDKVEEIVMD